MQVYDAKTMAEAPVVKIEMPQRVPLGFHGTWIYTEQLKLQDTSMNY
jgi:carotenoid cleavage dioxygenase-like enzyme